MNKKRDLYFVITLLGGIAFVIYELLLYFKVL